MAARAQPGQLCAGFRTIPRQAASDRRSQCIVSIPLLTPGYSGGFRTQSRGLRGSSVPKGWQRKGRMVVRPSAADSSNGFDEEKRVDTRPHRTLQYNSQRPNGGPVIIEDYRDLDNPGQSAAVVPAQNATQSAAVVEAAVDKGTKVASSALDTIGNVLSGLELELDLGLKELTIKELVLKDLGLVFELKTAPTDKPKSEPPSQE